ncbi:MAG: O-antigen ligase family protein [Paludibacteraceae bacterium]|nr:O-antigen ligase family protein [Paludibacteraceae bacterium]
MLNKKSLHIIFSDITSWMLILSVGFLIATLPFGYTGALRIAIYLLLGTYIIDYVVSGVYKGWSWKSNKNKWLYLIMIAFFLLQLIFYPFETHLDYFHQIFEDRLSFLAIGIIGIFGINKRLKLEYAECVYIIVAFLCSATLLSCCLKPMSDWYSLKTHLIERRLFYFSSHMLFNGFINIAIIFSFHFLIKSKNIWLRVALIFALLTMLITISFSEGRIGLICAYATTLFFLTAMLWKWKKWSIIIALIPLLGVSAVIFNNEKFSTQNLNKEPRKIIWAATIRNIKDNPLGLGASTAAYKNLISIEELENQGELYDETVHQAVVERSIYGAHAHNQYLQSTLEYGPIGGLLLLTLLILPMFICHKNITLTTIAVCFVYAMQLSTDILVSGVIPIGLLLTLCLLMSYNITPDNSKL